MKKTKKEKKGIDFNLIFLGVLLGFVVGFSFAYWVADIDVFCGQSNQTQNCSSYLIEQFIEQGYSGITECTLNLETGELKISAEKVDLKQEQSVQEKTENENEVVVEDKNKTEDCTCFEQTKFCRQGQDCIIKCVKCSEEK